MSTKKKFNLETLRKAMQESCETNEPDYFRQALYGPTKEELDAEHEAEFRLYMEEVDFAKRLSLIEFLEELNNPNYECDFVDEPPTALASDVTTYIAIGVN